MEPGDSFFALRKFVKGKINQYELEGADKSIGRVIASRENPALSKVIIEFTDMNEFGKIIGLDDDDIWFEQAINNPYNTYDIQDSSTSEQDFLDGYGPWYNFDSDNKELLQRISKLIYSKKFDYEDEEDRAGFAVFLEKYYPREIGSIVIDWTHEKNIEIRHVASEHVNSELNNFLGDFGFQRHGDGIKTTVGDLISNFIQYNVPHVSIKKLLKTIFQDSNRTIGGWDEDRFEYQDDDVFDNESFNKEANRSLEKILERIEEDYESGDSNTFMDMIDRVTKKHKIGIWYEIPKGSDLIFRIDGFDRETKKIDISLKKKKGMSGINKFKISEDGFNKLLYQPELFNLVEL